MSNLGFFTALKFNPEGQTCHQSLTQKIDGYFYFGSRHAKVLQGVLKNGKEVAVLKTGNVSRLMQVALIISYFTVLIPLLMLVAKVALRLSYDIKVVDSNYISKMKPLPVNSVNIPQESPLVPAPVFTQLQSLPSVPVPAQPVVVPIPTTPQSSAPPPQAVLQPISAQPKPNPVPPKPVIRPLHIASRQILDPNSPQVAQDENLTRLRWQIEKYVNPLDIHTLEEFDVGSNKTCRIANAVPGCRVEVTKDRKIVIDGTEPIGPLSNFDTDVFVFRYKEKIFLYTHIRGAFFKGNEQIIVYEAGTPPQIQLAKDLFIATVAPSKTFKPTDPEVVNNPHIQALQERVGNYVGARQILSYETFEGFGGVTFRIANSTNHKFQMADDPDRTLLINGQYTGLASVAKDTSFFMFDFNGATYLYNKDDVESIDDDTDLYVITHGETIAIPGKVSRFGVTPAPSTILDPKDVRLKADPHVKAIKEKVEHHLGKTFDVTSFETFTTFGDIKIKIVSCVPWAKIQIAMNPKRNMLFNGQPMKITNSADDAYYFVFQHNNIIYFYNKDDAAALSGDNVVVVSQNQGFLVSKARDLFPTDVAPTLSNVPNGLTVLNDHSLESVHYMVERYFGPCQLQTFETFTPNLRNITIANSTSRKIQIASDLKSTILVDGHSSFIDMKDADCIFAWESSGDLYLRKWLRNRSSSMDPIVVIPAGQSRGTLKSARDVFPPLILKLSSEVDLSTNPLPPTLLQIQAKVQQKLGKADVVSCRVFKATIGSISIANCIPNRKVEISEDLEILLDGKGTNLQARDSNDTCIFAYEENGNVYLYYIDDQSPLVNVDNFVGVIGKGLGHGAWERASKLFPASPSAAPTAPPTLPQTQKPVTGSPQTIVPTAHMR